MFEYLAWYSRLLTEFLGWGSFLVACPVGVVSLLGQRGKIWGLCCLIYGVLFLTLRFFFSLWYFRWIPGLAIALLLACSLRCRNIY